MSPALPAALRLIVILDADAAGGKDLAALAVAAWKGGATMLQVRGKRLSPRALMGQVRAVLDGPGGVLPVVVNDRLDVALAAGAAGCHLGQDDLPIEQARRAAPAGFVLGGSAGTEDEAARAARQGADYLGIGPIRITTTKADAGEPIGAEGFRMIRTAAGGVPAVAIGGITAKDVPKLLEAGAAGIAVSGAVIGADDVEAAARALRQAVDGRQSTVDR